MSEKKSELRGKSWKREREERGRRQLAQKDYSISTENNELDGSKNETMDDRDANCNSSAVKNTVSEKQKGKINLSKC